MNELPQKPQSNIAAVMRSTVLDEQCPSNNYKQGQPQGKCWGDGHYECKNCKHYREDFKRLGQEYIDFAYQIQGLVYFTRM